jgi:hypothetical protein
MKGGLYINDKYTSDSAFMHFINNSEISLFSSGGFGIIFKCDLYDNIESPYENLRTIYKEKPVRSIIIKFSLLHYGKEHFSLGKFNSVSVDNFENEVKIQNEIFNETVNNLDPICPSIIYTNYLHRGEKKEIINEKFIGILDLINSKIKQIESKMNKNDYKLLSSIFKILYIKLKKYNTTSFGMIGMEMMDDYKTLYYINNDSYENISKLRLIELAVKTGYSHNDYHKGNILVNDSVKGYYGDTPGNVLLIDFGYCKKIPEDILELINEYYKNNNFTGILDIFYNEEILSNKFPNEDSVFHFKNFPDLYSWIHVMNDKDEKKIEQINKDITKLKNNYEDYERKVEKTGLKYERLFTYGDVKKELVNEEHKMSIKKKITIKDDEYKIGGNMNKTFKNSKRSNNKRSNNKRSNNKRSNNKRSNNKRSNNKRSNNKRSNNKRSNSKRSNSKRSNSNQIKNTKIQS